MPLLLACNKGLRSTIGKLRHNSADSCGNRCKGCSHHDSVSKFFISSAAASAVEPLIPNCLQEFSCHHGCDCGNRKLNKLIDHGIWVLFPFFTHRIHLFIDIVQPCHCAIRRRGFAACLDIGFVTHKHQCS
ncbi:hypothetical protein BITS_1460 [Bifidobacterium tsurumiense]|uniref:Uncharacterized protein n=1 Tax=Bifidobacterium tsurumiense TaxID=356829 RepID=A0A087EAY9_9BIFI|nr:hypothetical protein BITS_1460 [Bifidobacterium tsurumiense]